MKRIFALFLIPLAAIAEPGPVTQYLSNEPATLFDIGMMRLETLTTEFEKRVGLHWTEGGEMNLFRAEINSRYEPDNDKIYVSFLVMNSTPTEEQMAEGCANAMSQMNIWLLKSLHELFAHTGDVDSSHLPEFHTGLKDMFELRCHFSSGRSTSEGRFWASRGLTTLGDREMNIGKWEMSN
jgi:hypothetical protein